MQVYKSINLIQKELSKTGITKDRKNAQQGYNFRSIDDIFNTLSPLLAEHGLCILPRVLSRECVERTTAKGSIMLTVTVEAEFDFVCAEDGSKHIVKTYGEAMDMADKATNKAMSAAYKYACLQAFAIPTEGENDSDGVTHEPIKAQPKLASVPKPEPKPLKPFDEYKKELGICKSLAELQNVWSNIYNEVKADNNYLIPLTRIKEEMKSLFTEKK